MLPNLTVDRIVICGSANLNDRSQLGSRDSEVAVVIEEPPTQLSHMNGSEVLVCSCVTDVQWDVSPFAASLRRKLCREHLGLLPPDAVDTIEQNSHPLPLVNQYDWGSKEDRLVEDPLSQEFWRTLTNTAKINTDIFRNIFHAVPDDLGNCLSLSPFLSIVRNTKDYDNFVTNTPIGHVADYSMPLEHVVTLLSRVRGHIVEMPLHYLEDTQLIQSGLNLSINDLTGQPLKFQYTY
jgi:phospholipase D1/2